MVVIANNGPDGREVAVVLQATPNGRDAPADLPADGQMGGIALSNWGTKRWVGTARGRDNGRCGSSRTRIVNQRVAKLRSDFAHDALGRLLPASLVGGEVIVAPSESVVGCGETPVFLRVAEADAVLFGQVVINAGVFFPPRNPAALVLGEIDI